MVYIKKGFYCFCHPSQCKEHFSFLYPGSCLAIVVHQSPSVIIKSPGDKVLLFCTHGRADYRALLWYQQPVGQTAMKLIGHVNFNNIIMEKSHEHHFNISGDLSKNDAKNVSLTMLARFKDSAIYYCAAREAR